MQRIPEERGELLSAIAQGLSLCRCYDVIVAGPCPSWLYRRTCFHINEQKGTKKKSNNKKRGVGGSLKIHHGPHSL